jgi:two-component system, sensor histidine kinase and response regulator
MAWAKNRILAAVAMSTVVAAGYWADALGPLVATLLMAIGGAMLVAFATLTLWVRPHLAALSQSHAIALQRRDERLAQTAHELRTPLTAVMNSLDIIRSGFATTAEEIEGFLEEADLAARHLSFLMNDVLDLAAIDAGKLRLEVADHRIELLMQEGMRMLGMQAARNPITITTDGNDRQLAVRADARRLLQVLFNLISNSIKNCDPGQLLEIIIRRESEHVLFRVLDEGRGVAASARPHLFTPFAGDDANHRADSTGLGLTICRDLVEQMGGAIGYIPRPVGSEFWFTLPLAAQQIIAPIEPVAQ